VTKKTGAFLLMSLTQETRENSKAQASFFIKKAKSRSQTGGWVGSTNYMRNSN